MAGTGRVEDADRTSAESCISDCESSVTGPVHGASPSLVIRLEENGHEHISLKHRFYSSLGPLSVACRVVATYKNAYSTDFAASQLEAFHFASWSMRKKRGGNPNIKLAWLGTSRDGVGRIVSRGFCLPQSAGSFGLGLYLSPENCAVDSLATCTVDAYGLRHLLLCKVIMGNTERIPLGSKQSSPSNEEFDSGVDDEINPTRYIVWNAQVKTHVLPMFVISIRMEHHTKVQQKHAVKRPSSPWVPLGTLVSMLSCSCLPSHMICLIKELHNTYLERKITRQQLIHHIRKLAGDRLLVAAIRAFQDKKHMDASFMTVLKRGKRI